jgi:hypothetical protein
LAKPVRARRLTQDEGRKLQQLVRRGKHDSVRVRRALIIMASASGTPVPAIARLVAGHEDTVRDVIHAFNEIGLRCPDPQWAGGRPRLINDDDIAFIVATATARNKVELCLTPTSASWANPIEAQFGPLRMFTMANSNHPNHTVLGRELHRYLRWRNLNARHPDVLAAQRRERARVRSQRQQRWGRPRFKAA